MSITAIHHLNCATMCPVAGHFLGQRGKWRGLMVAHCLLVETAKDGLVLVDTGFGERDLEDPRRIARTFKFLVKPRLDPAETAIAQVRALGFSPEDVRHVVVTHLDLDHAGGLPDFPNAKVHVHTKEHGAAMARSTLKERERYLPHQWAHPVKWELYAEDGDTWRGLPAITKLRGLDADIAIVPMHGHSRGHAAIVVPRPGGQRFLVHAGDAYFNSGAIGADGKTPFGFQVFERAMQMDGAARRASVAALRQLNASYDDVDIFSAHDPAEFHGLAGVQNHVAQ